MTAQPEFTLLRPRRLVAPAPADSLAIGGIVSSADALSAGGSDAAVPALNAATELKPCESCPPQPDEAPTDAAGENATREPMQPDTAARAEVPAVIHDVYEQAAELRAEAARFAAMACARALRSALAENPETITRFVDDALRACGRIARASARLHPEDAAAFRPQRDVEVTADATLERGEVVVETDGGSVAATLDQRAMLLARSAADA